LEQKQAVVMDNLGAHKPNWIKELIEERGCEFLYLRPYSPDYNPIGEAFGLDPLWWFFLAFGDEVPKVTEALRTPFWHFWHPVG
jgi:DDE superfamily endonuclease